MKFVNGSMVHEIGDIVINKVDRQKYKIVYIEPDYITAKKVKYNFPNNWHVFRITHDMIEVPLVEYCKVLRKELKRGN